MIRILACLFAFSATPLFAECEGNDQLVALPQDVRAELHEKAEAHPYARGILWRATRGDQSIHIIGTMHFHDARHDATLEQVKPWVDAAKTVFLEIGDGDEARLQDMIARNPGLAFIIQGPTLAELLTPEDWQLLQSAMQDRGVPSFMAAKMKPWMAMLTLGLSKCAVLDQQAGLRGLDQAIIEYAGEVGNPAQALESLDTALTLFEGYSEDEMLEFLSLSLHQVPRDPNDQHVTMTNAYFREDIRVIWEFAVHLALEQPMGMTQEDLLFEMGRLEEALIIKRNIAWMDRILPAAQAGPVLVAVGALHLPGEQGVLALLEREGFTISPVARAP